ncbi:hypothetical protein DSO57_1029611 [Entomophthora muscae]|uniref:Uncharacterized protein n=1 Tax=Entomophthora muscae TaxID=34485 RepID=A0ACC2U068_9FUNG|nr:hypothetical protein DSO57_1029611 [Entomophthora muscae]
MSHLTTALAMKMISPLDTTTNAYITKIATILKKDGFISSKFNVFPEQNPPICALCLVMGHIEALYPSNIEGVFASERSAQKVITEPEAIDAQTNSLKSLPWGSLPDYQMVALMKKPNVNVVNAAIYHVLISPLMGCFEDKSLAFAFVP